MGIAGNFHILATVNWCRQCLKLTIVRPANWILAMLCPYNFASHSNLAEARETWPLCHIAILKLNLIIILIILALHRCGSIDRLRAWLLWLVECSLQQMDLKLSLDFPGIHLRGSKLMILALVSKFGAPLFRFHHFLKAHLEVLKSCQVLAATEMYLCFCDPHLTRRRTLLDSHLDLLNCVHYFQRPTSFLKEFIDFRNLNYLRLD